MVVLPTHLETAMRNVCCRQNWCSTLGKKASVVTDKGWLYRPVWDFEQHFVEIICIEKMQISLENTCVYVIDIIKYLT